VETKQKQNIMTNRKFENVEINQTVSFYENDMIETGVVRKVDHNMFFVEALRSWDNKGVITFYEKSFSFYKTGTKTHHRHTNGNAIEITGTI
jgi:hypothetical protein